jgi:hypothetical protein
MRRKSLIDQGADPATFQLIDQIWARDKHDIYLGRSAIESCDLATFKIVRYKWAVDSQCAYAGFNKLPGADPSTFSVLNRGYAKDKAHVYAAFRRKLETEDFSNLPIVVQNEIASGHLRTLYRADRIDLHAKNQ